MSTMQVVNEDQYNDYESRITNHVAQNVPYVASFKHCPWGLRGKKGFCQGKVFLVKVRKSKF